MKKRNGYIAHSTLQAETRHTHAYPTPERAWMNRVLRNTMIITRGPGTGLEEREAKIVFPNEREKKRVGEGRRVNERGGKRWYVDSVCTNGGGFAEDEQWYAKQPQ